jgi:hypothetical protein
MAGCGYATTKRKEGEEEGRRRRLNDGIAPALHCRIFRETFSTVSIFATGRFPFWTALAWKYA